MTQTPPRLLCIGAHPDDCEIKSGGLAALWTANGGEVRFVSMTDGSSGHQTLGGGTLARQRRAEFAAGSATVGAESIVFDNTDGTLLPTLDNRHRVIRAIREFAPDVVASHRPNDYHPDHRYTGVTVQDSCYMVMVPNVVPNVPVPAANPVFIFMTDAFSKPTPLEPDLIFDLTDVIEKKLDAIGSHTCQMNEWMPWVGGYESELPADPQERAAFVRAKEAELSASEAVRFRDALIAKYGAERGGAVSYAEAFEVSEYGGKLTDEAKQRLFPF
jgi:LmbE family N-acetylglucosaminyl deacetylase